MKKILFALSALSMVSLSAPAFSQAADYSSPWFLRAGIADVQNMHKYTVSVGGGPVPGAQLDYHHVYTPLAEIGYSFADDWAAVATVGFPPAISAYGRGSIAPYGKQLSTTFGPTAFTIQYQPFHSDVIRPYIGAGVSYLIIFSVHDASLQQAALTNDFAPAFEVGSDFALDPHYGLFVEVKKAFLHSKSSGTFAGFPVLGVAAISPWVFSTGATFHF